MPSSDRAFVAGGIVLAIVLGVGTTIYSNWDIIQVEEAKRKQRIREEREKTAQSPSQ